MVREGGEETHDTKGESQTQRHVNGTEMGNNISSSWSVGRDFAVV